MQPVRRGPANPRRFELRSERLPSIPNAGSRGKNELQRYNQSYLAGLESRLLDNFARRIPLRIRPNHLTLLGVFGAAVVFAGYALCQLASHWLWLSNLGLVLHWLGDSLDGTIARLRQIERPQYGFYLDQVVDTVGNLLIAAGLGISPWVRMDVALLVLALYHMLSIQTFVRTILEREFHLAVGGFGPTEFRVGILALNLAILAFGAPSIIAWPLAMTQWDCLLLIISAIMAFVFIAELREGLARAATRDADPPSSAR